MTEAERGSGPEEGGEAESERSIWVVEGAERLWEVQGSHDSEVWLNCQSLLELWRRWELQERVTGDLQELQVRLMGEREILQELQVRLIGE